MEQVVEQRLRIELGVLAGEFVGARREAQPAAVDLPAQRAHGETVDRQGGRTVGPLPGEGEVAVDVGRRLLGAALGGSGLPGRRGAALHGQHCEVGATEARMAERETLGR